MAERSRRTLRILFVIAAALAVVFVGMGVWRSLHGNQSAPVGGPPAAPGGPAGPGMAGGSSAGVTVTVGQAQRQDVPVYQTALGTVVANASVTVTSRVDGQLQAVYFTEGQPVKKASYWPRSTLEATRRPWPSTRAIWRRTAPCSRAPS